MIKVENEFLLLIKWYILDQIANITMQKPWVSCYGVEDEGENRWVDRQTISSNLQTVILWKMVYSSVHFVKIVPSAACLPML